VSDYYAAYGTVLALIVAGIAVAVIAFTLNRVLRPDKKYGGKLSTYECGLDPVGTGWSQTHIRYYLFAFMFVVFDVETLFIFPWAVQLGAAPGEVQGFMLGVMLVFLFFVTLTLPYEYRKGVLKWV